LPLHPVRPIALLALAAALNPARAEGLLLTPLAGVHAEPPPPWYVAGLPKQTKPLTQFSIVDIDGRRALRVEADSSYGNLVHPLNDVPAGLKLTWRWRVDRLVGGANLRAKSGDDVSLKVCVFFDEPLQNLPFVDRQVLRIARSQTTQLLPAATVCYVWDGELPPGTALDNAFTKRLRYIVLQSGSGGLRQWAEERRDIGADFLKLFGAEMSVVPPVIGVAVGADADNTHTRSLGFVTELALQP
jgi:Protein of unknown function (DUF3047)